MFPQNVSNPSWPSFGATTPGGGASDTAGATNAAQPSAGARNEAEAQALMTKGVELLKQHRYDEALEAFRAGNLLYPSRNFILNEAAALNDSGRYGEAVLAYDRYLIDPDPARADEARAAQDRARAALGGVDVTIAGVEEANRLDSAGTQAMKEGRYDEALDAFERAAALNPLASLEFKQAQCCEKLGRPYAAASHYDAYLLAKPQAHDAGATKLKADALRKQGDAAPITASGLAGAQEWNGRGIKALREHRYDDAVAAFREGFLTYPDEKFILNEASALLDGGRYTEADLAYSRYLINPDAPRADEARAAQQRARDAVGGREASITDVAKAHGVYDRAMELFDKKHYAEALQQFENAYNLAAAPATLYMRAACLEKMGRREEASRLYTQYAREAPAAPDAAKTLKHAAALHDEARGLARAAFERGDQALKHKRFGDAAMAYAEANAHLPSPNARYNLALALENAGETAKAVREYQLYLNENPKARDADDVRAHIRELQAQSGNALMQP